MGIVIIGRIFETAAVCQSILEILLFLWYVSLRSLRAMMSLEKDEKGPFVVHRRIDSGVASQQSRIDLCREILVWQSGFP